MNNLTGQDYEKLCLMFETRAVRMTEHIKRLLEEKKESLDRTVDRLTRLAEAICSHEIKRRREMLRTAGEALEAMGISEEKLKKHTADIPREDFDAEEYVSRLKHSAPENTEGTAFYKRFITELIGSLHMDEDKLADFGEGFAQLRLYASEDEVRSAKEAFLSRIGDEANVMYDTEAAGLYTHYAGFTEIFKGRLSEIVLSVDENDPPAQIAQEEGALQSFLRIDSEKTERDYGVDIRGSTAYAYVKGSENDVMLVTAPRRGALIPYYPYPASGIDAVLKSSFGNYRASEVNRPLRLDLGSGSDLLAYPIVLYNDHFKVLPPSKLADEKEKLRHRVDGKRLVAEVPDGCLALIYMMGDVTDCDPEKYVETHPSGLIGFAKRHGSSEFSLPLANAYQSITLLAIGEHEDTARTVQVFAGEKITVDYKTEYRRRGITLPMLSAVGGSLTVSFTAAGGPATDSLPTRLLPPMRAYRCESELTGAEEDGAAPLFEIPSTELTESQTHPGMLTAQLTYPAYDQTSGRVRLEFKTPSPYFKLRNITE